MKLTPKKILWPTDFSSTSLHGANYARALREMFRAELHVIHVIPPMLGPELPATIPPEMPPIATDPGLLANSKRNLTTLAQDTFGSCDGIVCEAFFGNPWDAVCEYAKQHEIDLIVIATHGRTGLAHALIGSTAERIVQHAPCPVLTIKQGARSFVSAN